MSHQTAYPFYLFRTPVQSWDSTTPTGFMASEISFSEAESFAPRVTSTKGETDLDGTLHHTFSVSNGFSKKFTDDNHNYRVVGNYNSVDATLYPPLPWTAISTGSAYLGTSYDWSAKTTSYDVTFAACRENATNRIYRVTDAGVLTNLTLPVTISAHTTAVHDLVMHKDHVFALADTTASQMAICRMDVATSTWTAMTGHHGHKAMSMRDNFYYINYESEIYRLTNETSGTAVSTFIAQCGPADKTVDLPLSFIEFNGAGWVAKHSGLYRFDGVAVVKVLNQRPDYMTVHNGALYFVTNGWLYRFNGSLIEKIKYFGRSELIINLQSHLDNLYILTVPDISTYKYGGSSADGSIDYRIFEYDGVNFRVFYEEDSVTPGSLLTSVGSLLLLANGATGSFPVGFKSFNLTTLYTAKVAGQPSAYVITADFDGDLPNILKLLHRVQIDIDNRGVSDTVTIAYDRYINASWNSAGSVTFTPAAFSSNVVNYPLPSALGPAYTSFERIRLRITLTPAVGSSASLSSFTIHYTLHPRQRRRFTATVPITGNSVTTANQLLDGSVSSISSNREYFLLREYMNPTFYGFTYLLGPEAMKLKTSINSSTNYIVVGNDFYWSHTAGYDYNYLPVFALYDGTKVEFIRTQAFQETASDTTLFSTRGEFKTTAASFTNTNTYVYPVMLLSRSRIVSDRIIPHSENLAFDSENIRQVNRQVSIELTEL